MANVNAQDNKGLTPLDVLALSDSSFKKEATQIKIAGRRGKSKPTRPQWNDSIASGRLRLARLLVTIWCNIFWMVAQILICKIYTGAHQFTCSCSGPWPWNSARGCLQELAKAKADFSIKDDQGKTPLHYLAALGGKQPLFFIRGIDPHASHRICEKSAGTICLALPHGRDE